MQTELNFFPKVSSDLDTIVKPEILVDVIEMAPLSLKDRRLYNLLLGNAWNDITASKTHQIAQTDITKHTHSKNYDVAAGMRRLQAAIIVVKISHNKNGKEAIRQMPLLGSNEIELNGGALDYNFDPLLIKTIKNTKIFARIRTQVMFALSSKYSLALYEWLQKRINLKYIDYEILSIEAVRGLLGVPKDKLKTYGNLYKFAIKPAILEVNFLTEYEIIAEPIKTGRIFTHIKFTWAKKKEIGAKVSAIEELSRSKVGRKKRMQNKAKSGELTPFLSQKTTSSNDEFFHIEQQIKKTSQKTTNLKKRQISNNFHNIRISAFLMEEARNIVINAGTGWDIYLIEQEFYNYAETKGLPDNIEKAWRGFVNNKVKTSPKALLQN
ncbi:MAG: replication initiation protein [Rhizobiales bacterium]|nr:replication initiation protein [Hyphomicrobiales bacterium]